MTITERHLMCNLVSQNGHRKTSVSTGTALTNSNVILQLGQRRVGDTRVRDRLRSVPHTMQNMAEGDIEEPHLGQSGACDTLPAISSMASKGLKIMTR